MIFSLMLGIEYATIDEIHQLFIDGRAGQVIDVFIDAIGISIGICVAMLIHKIINKRKEAFSNKKQIC